MSEELTVRIVLGAVMGLAGLLLLWVASAGADGRLRRNAFVGIRTRSTLTSDEAWLAAHRRAESPTRLAGVAALLAAAMALVPGPEDLLFASVVGAAAVILALSVYGAVVGGRASREADAR